MVVTSILSFSLNVFYPIKSCHQHLICSLQRLSIWSSQKFDINKKSVFLEVGCLVQVASESTLPYFIYRTLLCEVVRVKMQTFQLSKGRSETAEEFCKGFLDRDVRPIWPKGWMQKVVLFKESRPAHANWTNPYVLLKLPSYYTPSTHEAEGGILESPWLSIRPSVHGHNFVPSFSPTVLHVLL